MNEMIERVALAISGGDDPASILGIHRSRARLAIEAVRDYLKQCGCDTGSAIHEINKALGTWPLRK